MVFGGSVNLWLLGSLTGIVRGTGDMKSAAPITVFRAIAAMPLFLILILGWGPVPRFGITGAAIAMLAYYTFGVIGMVAHLQSARSTVHLTLSGLRRQRRLFYRISRWHRFPQCKFSSPASR